MKRSKKNKYIILLVIVFFIFCIWFNWRYSPFLPHINWNLDGSFEYKNTTYMAYMPSEDEISEWNRGKRVAVIRKEGDLFPRASIYEVKGSDNQDILIVFKEIFMYNDEYYIKEE